MKFARISAVVIVCVGVIYGVCQVASEPAGNDQTNSPGAVVHEQPLVEEISVELQ